MLEATIHGSREGRATALPPPHHVDSQAHWHHKASGVDRDTHPTSCSPEPANARSGHDFQPPRRAAKPALGLLTRQIVSSRAGRGLVKESSFGVRRLRPSRTARTPPLAPTSRDTFGDSWEI